jgi:hypothetical protein
LGGDLCLYPEGVNKTVSKLRQVFWLSRLSITFPPRVIGTVDATIKSADFFRSRDYSCGYSHRFSQCSLFVLRLRRRNRIGVKIAP